MTVDLCEQRLGDGPDTLRVEGCVGALCGGENWTRAGREHLAALHHSFEAHAVQAAVAFNAVAADA